MLTIISNISTTDSSPAVLFSWTI